MLTRREPGDLHEARRGLRRVGAALTGVCGGYQFALGLYFVALRPPLLPEDLRFLGAGAETLRATLPRLEAWLHLVFIVMGGQMAAVGVLTLAAALRLGRDLKDGRELALLGAAAVLSVAMMSAANFALGSASRWLLIAPVGIWALGLALMVLSRAGASKGAMMSGKTTERDHAG